MSIHHISENTIEQIGTAYMSGMNEQVSLHFETIIELRLTMAESIAHIAVDEGNSSYGPKEEIEYGARVRHFSCTALYSSDGNDSLAIAVGLSTKYMGEVLFLDSDNSLSYSFVIRKDGSYVVGNENGVQKNYFDRLYSVFGDQSKEAATHIEQLTAAMSANEDYSAMLKDGESRRHLYCTSLPYCE